MDIHDPDLVRRANSLYWDSEESVNDIADKLDLSKGSLYGIVEPLPAGYACPECGTPLEFSNRTARDKGLVSCPKCGLEEEVELIRALVAEGAGDSSTPRPPLGDRMVSSRTAMVSGLLGLAAGLAIGQLTRKR